MRFVIPIVSLFVSFNLSAKPAPAGMTEFNKKCPAPKICDDLNDALESCKNKRKSACNQFVDHYKAVLPEYDCQRPFDSTPTQKYVVPAIWLCENEEVFLNFLSKLKTKKARQLFGSQQLRETLDGDLAEQYLRQSLAIEKTQR